MARKAPVVTIGRDDTSRKRDDQAHVDKKAFGERVSARIEELGISGAEVSRRAGLGTSTLSRYVQGESIPNSEQLFPLADALRVGPRWLMYGVGPKISTDLRDVDEADWVSLPSYSLYDLFPGVRGEPSDQLIVRKDWLYHAFRTSSGLWLTKMPADDHLIAREGDPIVCQDLGSEGLVDQRFYIFLLDETPIIRRFTRRPEGVVLTAGDSSIEPILVPADQFPPKDTGRLFPVARVLGAFMKPVG